MKPRPFLFAIILGLALSGSVFAQAPAAPSAPAKKAAPITEPADEAWPKKDPATGQPNERFMKMHESFLARGKEGPIGVLFLGDSITAGWAGKGKQVWDQNFTQYQPANFGIGGDRTQHVLWRIANGELDGINPKVVVLMIGTNNNGYPVEDIVKGDKKIVEQIHAKLPNAKLLLLGIFPRGVEPNNPLRLKMIEANKELAKLHDGKKTFYLDIGDKFLAADGTLSKDIMPDALHPNEKGYQIWADAIKQPLADLMK